jgi:tetratricopeptide (TPR) repeat protein
LFETINATDTSALFKKGLALDNLGNYTGAIKYYDKALDIDPNDKLILDNKHLVQENLSKK